MSAEDATRDLARKVLDSKDPELRRLVAAGLAPLPLAELLAVQVQLAKDDDSDISETARASLREIDPRIAASVIQDDASEEVLRYFAHHSEHPIVTEAILQLRSVPTDLLVEMAAELDAEMQEYLLFRQDAIVEEPAILDALESNPKLSTYSGRRIAEYREHLLPRDEVEEPEPEEPEPEEDEEDPEVERIRKDFEKAEEHKSGDDLDAFSQRSEIEIRTLPVAKRIKLARRATTGLLRRLLVRDQNANVALAVMKFSPIKESEVEHIALSRVVVDDVLTYIARSRHWTRRYNVIHALCQNPRTPVNVGIRLLPRLSARHLLQLSRNRGVSDALRGRALRLYRIKVQ